MSYKRAARVAGVSEDTLHRWRKRGRDDLAAGRRTTFAPFCMRLERAEDETPAEYLDAVRKSVLEPTKSRKTKIKELPDGRVFKEIDETVTPPNIKGALW